MPEYELTQITLEVAQIALSFCSNVDREDWVENGMAIKSEFGDLAYDMWYQWGSTTSADRVKTSKGVWRSFRRKGINIGTVIDKALKNGFKFENKELTTADKNRLTKEREIRQKQREKQDAEDQKKIDAWQQSVSDFLMSHLDKFTPDGKNDYLTEKQVPGFGCLFPIQPLILVVDPDTEKLECHYGYDNCVNFFKTPKEDLPTFQYMKPNQAFAIPMISADNQLWNFQIIRHTGSKIFLKGAKKSGCFHLIGAVTPLMKFNVCAAEGFANAAAIYMAMGCPVLVTFDAGNMPKVAKNFFDQYWQQISRFAFCADDDHHLEKAGKRNVGLEKAREAAALVEGFVIIPDMADIQPADPELPLETNPSPKADAADVESALNEALTGQLMDPDKPEDIDILLPKVITFSSKTKKLTVSAIQKEFKVGYNRARRMMDYLVNNDLLVDPRKNETIANQTGDTDGF